MRTIFALFVICILIAFSLHVGFDVRWGRAFIPLYILIIMAITVIALFLKSGAGPQ